MFLLVTCAGCENPLDQVASAVRKWHTVTGILSLDQQLTPQPASV